MRINLIEKSNQCIHNIFERVVEQRPAQIATRYAGRSITYAELDARANYLADKLVQAGVVCGDVVAISLPRSANYVVSMLGVLKCGAAYLPLDDNSPALRNLLCLQNAGAKILISDGQCSEELQENRIVISTDNAKDFHGLMERFDSYPSKPNEIAYVMYTSGSTGEHKGVAIPHQAVTRLVINSNYLGFKKSDCVLQLSSPSFDASTFEFWGALLNGIVLAIYSGSVLDPNILKRDIERYNISVLWLTAALFHLVADKFIEVLGNIRVLLAGGDVLYPKYVNKVLDRFSDITIINGYGPTENTTFTCCHVMTTENRPTNTVPIGVPITGTQIYILDDDLSPVECGQVGELYTSGKGVALGYIGESIPTDSFFTNKEISTGLIYRTGDLVRENAEGNLEFIGRQDGQVKIRGFRVVLEEIRLRIIELDQVSDAVVTVDKLESGDHLVVAYLQVSNKNTFNINQAKQNLRQVLPAYMIPGKVFTYAHFPLTNNGKVDSSLLFSGQYREG